MSRWSSECGPETEATAGKDYSYQIDARSREGGLTYKLESAPEGMTVSNSGEIRWPVAAQAAGTTPDVIVLIGDASGKELFHSFRIVVAE